MMRAPWHRGALALVITQRPTDYERAPALPVIDIFYLWSGLT